MIEKLNITEGLNVTDSLFLKCFLNIKEESFEVLFYITTKEHASSSIGSDFYNETSFYISNYLFDNYENFIRMCELLENNKAKCKTEEVINFFSNSSFKKYSVCIDDLFEDYLVNITFESEENIKVTLEEKKWIKI